MRRSRVVISCRANRYENPGASSSYSRRELNELLYKAARENHFGDWMPIDALIRKKIIPTGSVAVLRQIRDGTLWQSETHDIIPERERKFLCNEKIRVAWNF